MFRHVVLYFVVIVFSLLSSACAGSEILTGNMLVGSGRYASRDFALDGFAGIQASGGFQVTVTGGDTSKVSVTADDNILDIISVKKQGTTLILSVVQDKYSSLRTTKLDVAVTLPQLESVQLNGGCTLQVVGTAPRSTILVIDANGGSNIDLRSIAADRVAVSLNGGSQATVNAETNLDYDLNGGSQLRYTGSARIGKSKSEGGSLATRF